MLFAALHESGFGRFRSLTVKDNSSISRATSSGACVLCVLMRHLMGLAGRGAARLKSQSARVPHATESAPSSAPSLGRRSARELGSTSSLAQPARLCRFELGAVSQHGVHDDGEAPRQRDPRLAHGGSFGDRQCPVLELQRPLVARQHDVRGLVEKCPHPPIAAL